LRPVSSRSVIPAVFAGDPSCVFRKGKRTWIPAFAGMTTKRPRFWQPASCLRRQASRGDGEDLDPRLRGNDDGVKARSANSQVNGQHHRKDIISSSCLRRQASRGKVEGLDSRLRGNDDGPDSRPRPYEGRLFAGMTTEWHRCYQYASCLRRQASRFGI